MKIKFLKFKNWLLASIASAFGLNFVSCDRMFAAEYGTPSAEYEVKGTVTDEDGNPIKGIEVEMSWKRTQTAANGSYSVSVVEFPENEVTFEVAFNDIDSTENGHFKNDTALVTFRSSELTGGDGNWDEGSATKTLNKTLQRVDE